MHDGPWSWSSSGGLLGLKKSVVIKLRNYEISQLFFIPKSAPATISSILSVITNIMKLMMFLLILRSLIIYPYSQIIIYIDRVMSKSKNSIYLDDTIETFIFEKEALEIKLKHNIAELSTKNAYLTTILKQLCRKEHEEIKQDCEAIKQLIKTCRGLEDDLASLDILEKKTQILKVQVLALAYRFNKKNEIQVAKNTEAAIANQSNLPSASVGEKQEMGL